MSFTTTSEAAFLKVVKLLDGRLPMYRKVPDLESIPYVCLRLPTDTGLMESAETMKLFPALP